MTAQSRQSGTVRLHVERIGGITETDVEFDPGITVLAGRNATNRTSLLQAIMAVFGSETDSLKSDAEQGCVELDFDGETYSRTLRRENGTIRTGGDPYLEDTTAADLFAFLLESNETRRAVTQGDDLRDVITRPIDTDAVEDEIQQLQQTQNRISTELDELEELAERLPTLERRRTELQDQLAALGDELEMVRAEIETAEFDPTETADEELQAKLDELQETRQELKSVRREIKTERVSIEALEEDRTDLQSRVAELPASPVGDLDAIESEIEQLQSKRQSLDTRINELKNLVQFNEEMLEGEDTDLRSVLETESEAESAMDSPTDQLLKGDKTVCWTCGSKVYRDKIEETVETLQTFLNEKIEQRSKAKSEIDSLKKERIQIKDIDAKREKIEEKISKTESELQDRERRLERLTERETDLKETIDSLSNYIDSREEEAMDDRLELQQTANQLEFERDQCQTDLDEIVAEIEEIENRLSQREDLESRREEVATEIEELRNRVATLERNSVDQFNDHMDEILTILDYSNLERIWLERTSHEVRNGRSTVLQSAFTLHVVRSNEEGAAYEDTVDHLSESERKVTGLVFALAGYLVHEVYDDLPVMVLDSLEAIDSERIAALVEYFSDYAAYLVVALLEEDANALDDGHPRVRSI